MQDEDVYTSARAWWVLNRARAEREKYAEPMPMIDVYAACRSSGRLSWCRSHGSQTVLPGW
jgi:hypothetical protein